MAREKTFVHPYIPNSAPKIKAEILQEIGITDTEILYQDIPEELKFRRKLKLPKPFRAEHDLQKHVKSIMAKNKTCEENVSFLGGGCWQHYVPAVCDEINQRSEFLTAYGGNTYSCLGRTQAFFEFQSQMGELVGMDVVSVPTYSWGTAAGNAVRMASRITRRDEVLVARTVGPERLAILRTFSQPENTPGHLKIRSIDFNCLTGILDLQDLENKISSRTAGIYFENPSFLGNIEYQGKRISDIAHANGALTIVGVDPISLGVLKPPADYGADIVVGTAQSLGIRMNCGGGTIGFIASRDEEKYVAEYPSFLLSITDTTEQGEYAFDLCTPERTSWVSREKGKDWVGTATGLWTITAAVYMAIMGPNGFREIGETIIQKTHYAIKLLSDVKGLKILFPDYAFKEFVLCFDDSGMTASDINSALLDYNIFGGKDISTEFPELGNSALFCITELHSKEDIEKLAITLREVLSR